MCVSADSWPDVEGLLGGGLHAGGQLVAGDPGRQVVLARPLAEVIAVQVLQEAEKPLLRRAGDVCGGGSRFRIRGSRGRTTVP